jgi:hypothetical protein
MSPPNNTALAVVEPPPPAADAGLRTGTVATPTTTASRVPAPAAGSKAVTAAPVSVVDIAPAGVPVRVTSEQRPDDQEPLFCTGGPLGVLCVPRPPGVPEHTLPSLP